jgi:hypothetical protein
MARRRRLSDHSISNGWLNLSYRRNIVANVMSIIESVIS